LQKSGVVISIDDANAARERNVALIHEVAKRLAETDRILGSRDKIAQRLDEGELADDSPNG
jgi:hypothetical protein